MEVAYLHLVTNHIPIIGVPFALAVLLIGIWRNSFEIKALSFLIFLFLGLATIGVYLLGQGGEDFVEELAGVSHDAIEDHEEMATFGLASVLAVAAASLVGLILFRGFAILRPSWRKNSDVADANGTARTFPVWIVAIVLVLGLISSGVIGYTARLGGKIRHPEFHGGFATATDGEERNEADEADGDTEGGKGRGRNRGRR